MAGLKRLEVQARDGPRTLVAERSTMSTLITGECFDLPQNMIGLLLEGFIKMQGTLELITAPAALLPSYSDGSFQVSEIAGKSKFIRIWNITFEILL